MNEELYEHWAALREIKAMAAKLGILQRISKVYEDLPFNNYLFS
jgi:hypothetical protein